MAKKAATMSVVRRTQKETTLKELRIELNDLLKHQATDAPDKVIQKSLRQGHYPGKEGKMMDLLFARAMGVDDETFLDNLEVDEDSDSDDDDADVQEDKELETNGIDIPPRDTVAVDAEEREDRGHDLDITQRLQDIILGDQCQVASCVSASQSVLITEEKYFSGTTRKQQQRKPHWRPWE